MNKTEYQIKAVSGVWSLYRRDEEGVDLLYSNEKRSKVESFLKDYIKSGGETWYDALGNITWKEV